MTVFNTVHAYAEDNPEESRYRVIPTAISAQFLHKARGTITVESAFGISEFQALVDQHRRHHSERGKPPTSFQVTSTLRDHSGQECARVAIDCALR